MLNGKFERTAMLVGCEAIEKLKKKRVAVFGIGGVGGYVVEALVRSGIGNIDIIDNDAVSESNINRQLIADTSTVGKAKTDVMRERIMRINPECKVVCHNLFYLPENAKEFPFDCYDYIVDAVDTVTAKIDLILQANKRNIPIISSMGTGNKMNPSLLTVADIYDTSVCPLARVMRKELKTRNIDSLKVVYSKEKPIKPLFGETSEESRRATPGSMAFVPATAGLLIASEVVKELIGWEEQ